MTLHTFKRQLKAYLFHIGCVHEQNEHPPLCCGVLRDSGTGYKTADLLTYLLTMKGKRYQGKPKREWLDDMKQWSGEDYLQLD